jgi:hypothetical protein
MIESLVKTFGFWGAYAILAGGISAVGFGAFYVIDKFDDARLSRRLDREFAKRPKRPFARNSRRASKWKKISGPGEYGMWENGKKVIETTTEHGGHNTYGLSYDGRHVGDITSDLRTAKSEWVWKSKLEKMGLLGYPRR